MKVSVVSGEAGDGVKFLPRIPEELSGKHIFVTGGSGFMGKVLLEKLLRSCPEVGCIHVLLRPKKGVAVQERLTAIINTPLFDRLLREQPEAVSKLRAVAGDCSEIGLGLSLEDEAVLVDEVSYVFHAAATVRFDDPLKHAILLNTRGTREVVELCKRMRRIKVLQYVSTTYCFTNEPILKEQHYDAQWDWRTMIKIAEQEDKYTMDAISHKILGFQPNTYTFTKALAENIINDARHEVPVVIFRPAVVISSMTEPFPGWLDNLNGPFSIWAGALKGVLRFSWGDPSVALSYTPVDWAIRGMILCAVAKALKVDALQSSPASADFVNMEGSRYERQTYGSQSEAMKSYMNLAVNPIRYPSYHIGRCFAVYWLGTVLSELPYGLAIDTLLRLSGRKPRMIATYRKKYQANGALAHFMLNEFPIQTGKCDILHGVLHKSDRLEFGVDIKDPSTELFYDPIEFPKQVITGAFKYVFKEEATEEERARLLNRLYILELAIKSLVALVLYLTVGKFFIGRIQQMDLF